VLALPGYLARKAEVLQLADRTSEGLEAISKAEALAERFEQRVSFAELHRLRGVFLTALGAEETKIEASLCEAIRIARQRSKTISNASAAPDDTGAGQRSSSKRANAGRRSKQMSDVIG
jgi:hypothetical protein